MARAFKVSPSERPALPQLPRNPAFRYSGGGSPDVDARDGATFELLFQGGVSASVRLSLLVSRSREPQSHTGTVRISPGGHKYFDRPNLPGNRVAGIDQWRGAYHYTVIRGGNPLPLATDSEDYRAAVALLDALG